MASLKTRKDQKAAAKRAAPLKTAEKVVGHQAMDKECPLILKKQKISPANDAVEAKGIGDSSPVPSKSTKSKQGKTAAKGPLVTQQSSKVVVKAITSKATEDTAKVQRKEQFPSKPQKRLPTILLVRRNRRNPQQMMQLRPRELVIVLQFPLNQLNKKGDDCSKGTTCHSAFRQNSW